MIDISSLTEEQLNELELQIQKHREMDKFAGYKVTFYVKFIPENHRLDMLTYEGELNEGLFTDYLYENIASKILDDFRLDGVDEDVNAFSVEKATRQDLANIWGTGAIYV